MGQHLNAHGIKYKNMKYIIAHIIMEERLEVLCWSLWWTTTTLELVSTCLQKYYLLTRSRFHPFQSHVYSSLADLASLCLKLWTLFLNQRSTAWVDLRTCPQHRHFSFWYSRQSQQYQLKDAQKAYDVKELHRWTPMAASKLTLCLQPFILFAVHDSSLLKQKIHLLTVNSMI